MRGVDISPETWRKTQNLMKTIISGILAGIAISTGGTVFLLTDSKITGAIFFRWACLLSAHLDLVFLREESVMSLTMTERTH